MFITDITRIVILFLANCPHIRQGPDQDLHPGRGTVFSSSGPATVYHHGKEYLPGLISSYLFIFQDMQLISYEKNSALKGGAGLPGSIMSINAFSILVPMNDDMPLHGRTVITARDRHRGRQESSSYGEILP